MFVDYIYSVVAALAGLTVDSCWQIASSKYYQLTVICDTYWLLWTNTYYRIPRAAEWTTQESLELKALFHLITSLYILRSNTLHANFSLYPSGNEILYHSSFSSATKTGDFARIQVMFLTTFQRAVGWQTKCLILFDLFRHWFLFLWILILHFVTVESRDKQKHLTPYNYRGITL